MVVPSVNKMTKELTKWIYLVKVFGFFPVMEPIFRSLYLKQQMLLFCIISFANNLHYYTTQTSNAHLTPLCQLDWTKFMFVVAGQCCRTYLGLVAMCVTTSNICLCLFSLVNLYLFGWRSRVAPSDFPSSMPSINWVRSSSP